MLDHPLTQKTLATVAAAAFLATGGVAWNTRELTQKHEHDITALRETDKAIISDFKDSNAFLRSEVSAVGKDVSEIKTGVAVLKERTEILSVQPARQPGS